MKRQHENPEFGHKPGESHKKQAKFPYFTDITEREVWGCKEDQRHGEDRMNLWISLLPSPPQLGN
jgi:hypothetical protein